MKKGQIIYILAILSIVTCLAIPVMAADDNQTKDEATIYYNTAEQLLALNQYESAIASFDQALAANTTMIQLSDALLYTYRDMAYALIQLGRYDNALQTIEKGIALYPKDTMLWNNKGYALFRLQRYEQAVAAYDQALAIDKTYTKGLINKGDALYQMGKFSEAVDAYKKVLETDEGNRDATAGLALAEKASANANQQTMIIVLVIVVIVVAAGVIYYLKFRKPVEEKIPEKSKSKKKK
jgi:tetratricopeptide (TPR) repeat protein